MVMVEAEKFYTHEAFCMRYNIRCDVCSEMIDRREAEAHKHEVKAKPARKIGIKFELIEDFYIMERKEKCRNTSNTNFMSDRFYDDMIGNKSFPEFIRNERTSTSLRNRNENMLLSSTKDDLDLAKKLLDTYGKEVYGVYLSGTSIKLCGASRDPKNKVSKAESKDILKIDEIMAFPSNEVVVFGQETPQDKELCEFVRNTPFTSKIGLTEIVEAYFKTNFNLAKTKQYINSNFSDKTCYFTPEEDKFLENPDTPNLNLLRTAKKDNAFVDQRKNAMQALAGTKISPSPLHPLICLSIQSKKSLKEIQDNYVRSNLETYRLRDSIKGQGQGRLWNDEYDKLLDESQRNSNKLTRSLLEQIFTASDVLKRISLRKIKIKV